MIKKVVVLTGDSLLVQGLASRLRGYAHVFDVRMVDLASPDPLQQVAALQPEIIIFDEGDFKDATCPSLVDFMNSLPDVILLELRLDNPNVQLIQSTRFKASTTDDLVQLFQASGSFTAAANIS
jgi:hypothetical protein